MLLTSNYALKKPEGTDPVDVQDLNENADIIDAELKKRPTTTGNASDMTVNFTSGDSTTPASWSNVAALASGETHKSIMGKVSMMFKNIRYLYKMLGTTNIAAIGGGTVTGAIAAHNDSLAQINSINLKNVYQPRGTFNGNIDTMTSPINNGMYWVRIVDNPTGTHPFASGYYNLSVHFANTGTGVQVAYQFSTGKTYQRIYNNSQWYAWTSNVLNSELAWANITGKPSSYTPATHNHDERYYTETEINNLLASKNSVSIVEYRANFSAAANGIGTANCTISIPSGYNAYIMNTFSGNNNLLVYHMWREGNTVYAQFRNISSAAISSATAVILVAFYK